MQAIELCLVNLIFINAIGYILNQISALIVDMKGKSSNSNTYLPCDNLENFQWLGRRRLNSLQLSGVTWTVGLH